MTLNMIVAMTQDLVIGKENNLPWPRIPSDMKHFKKVTLNHAVIMGRKTFDSILVWLGKPLPRRTSIVLTRSIVNTDTLGVHFVRSIEEAIQIANSIDPEPFVIGGSEVYRQTLPLVSKIWLTWIKGNYTGDAFFPKSFAELVATWEEQIIGETPEALFTLLKKP